MRKFNKLIVAAVALSTAGIAQAGNIYLTGHDVLLHGGQRDYDDTIVSYLRDGAATYDIGLVRGFSGSVGGSSIAGADTRDLTSFADGAAFASYLSTIDLLIIPSHTSCGGCDLTTADADILESFSSEITDFFNAGGDIYANSGATDLTYYDFLPSGVATSGAPIGGSSGFTATAAGTAIGITSTMINGFPTHNRFFDFDTDFTVFETRGEEVISIGLRDGIISDDGISTDGGGDDGSTAIPEPSVLALLGLGLMGMVGLRRRRL